MEKLEGIDGNEDESELRMDELTSRFYYVPKRGVYPGINLFS
jgi:hypothetical protein